MYIGDAVHLADPVQLITPILMMMVLLAFIAYFIPSNFLDQLAWRFNGVGALGAGLIFGCALVLVDIVAPGSTSGFLVF